MPGLCCSNHYKRMACEHGALAMGQADRIMNGTSLGQQ